MQPKTYLITGAAKGLGRELSIQLYQAGHQLILLDKELKALNALYDELEDNEERIALYPIDLLGANIDDYKNMQAILMEAYPHGLDGVVLNAAILPAFTPIEHFDFGQWYEVLHTNLNANFHLIQQTLPLLRISEDGKLCAISDRAIHEMPAYYGAYGVAKAGLEQLMRTVATENGASNIAFYLAQLPAFATESRGRLYPGENPYELTSAAAVAESIYKALLEDDCGEWIEKLH
ncbi:MULTISPECIES: SDR family NAD(P)-dependent oxidoreductase [Thiomicrorhabdus]|uniref:SDR family NAD(P)-dependent oxidoreductase n=1 Tax=Thiomicrorhabdus heinhorstiae TaxID=2748010 RepID=A0ABS0BV14_9GAMM|nr:MULTISPECIES: SDR family NAD(P)-dependent oxidoreductase [Thiomicrorhabdus]MBF6056915.1 SDR family NAD(P)-dependent oxidoreductase [Thiomicrorhabdus heinhorstiae]